MLSVAANSIGGFGDRPATVRGYFYDGASRNCNLIVPKSSPPVAKPRKRRQRCEDLSLASLPQFPPMARRDAFTHHSRPFAGVDLPAWLEEPEPKPEKRQRTRYRTIWISDIHLGTSGCNADLL